jgi:hypothetical protein
MRPASPIAPVTGANRGIGLDVRAVRLDVTDAATMSGIAALGPVDVLVDNAGGDDDQDQTALPADLAGRSRPTCSVRGPWRRPSRRACARAARDGSSMCAAAPVAWPGWGAGRLATARRRLR